MMSRRTIQQERTTSFNKFAINSLLKEYLLCQIQLMKLFTCDRSLWHIINVTWCLQISFFGTLSIFFLPKVICQKIMIFIKMKSRDVSLSVKSNIFFKLINNTFIRWVYILQVSVLNHHFPTKFAQLYITWNV